MATSGSGTRGTFDETLSFSSSVHGDATLVVFESSAKDGSEVNVVEVGVKI